MRHYALLCLCAYFFPCHIIFTSSLPEIVSSFSIMEKQIDIRKPIGYSELQKLENRNSDELYH